MAYYTDKAVESLHNPTNAVHTYIVRWMLCHQETCVFMWMSFEPLKMQE